MSAGESHGPALTGIISGMPSGLKISSDEINLELGRRQMGIGRSERQKIEKDAVVISSGLRNGVTIGSPITLQIKNLDHENWLEIMPVDESTEFKPEKDESFPRPGHADLAGMLKHNFDDARNVLERASGRSTVITVAIGSICRQLLELFGVYVGSRIISYGPKMIYGPAEGFYQPPTNSDIPDPSKLRDFYQLTEDQIVIIKQLVDEARESGDTLGGSVQCIAARVPPGLGSCALPDERLDARLGGTVLGVPGIKAVEIGAGIEQSGMPGKSAHDNFIDPETETSVPWYAGGIEGGISNGQPVCLTAWMKPLATVKLPYTSISRKDRAAVEYGSSDRSDVSAVESAGCVIEAVVAIELASAFLEKFGGDTTDEVRASYDHFMNTLD